MRICSIAMHCLISCLKVRPGFSFKSTALILLTGVRGGWSYHVSVRWDFEANGKPGGCPRVAQIGGRGEEGGRLRLEAETG